MASGEPQGHSEHLCLGGHRAHVRVLPAARADAPTLVALHGFTGSGADFGPLREALGGNRFGWILPDFMGHGHSEAPAVIDPYLLPNLLQLVEQSRRLAGDPARVHLLGYSMGGRIALQYLARARPLPCLLVSASPGLDDVEERRRRRQADRALIDLRTDTVEGFCTRWESLSLIFPQTRLGEPLASELQAR
ncbi:MAG: alpha/beta fold hydrolase, partial [Oceanipulchritudo sp.]